MWQTWHNSHLLTYSMVQSPSWEANWFAASQEITRISRNPKVHYRTHKRPPPVSILGQPNPVHIPTSHFLEIHPNIIHPSTPKSPQWSLSLRFPPPRSYTLPSPHPYAPYAQPISFFSLLSPAQYWVSSTNHLATYWIKLLKPIQCWCLAYEEHYCTWWLAWEHGPFLPYSIYNTYVHNRAESFLRS